MHTVTKQNDIGVFVLDNVRVLVSDYSYNSKGREGGFSLGTNG